MINTKIYQNCDIDAVASWPRHDVVAYCRGDSIETTVSRLTISSQPWFVYRSIPALGRKSKICRVSSRQYRGSCIEASTSRPWHLGRKGAILQPLVGLGHRGCSNQAAVLRLWG